jgi:hypothetical protein
MPEKMFSADDPDKNFSNSNIFTRPMNSARFDQHLVAADPTVQPVTESRKADDTHPRALCGK